MRVELTQARFSLWQVARLHETAGLLVQDLMREERVWLVDENLEQTAPVGLTLAMRVSTPDAFNGERCDGTCRR